MTRTNTFFNMKLNTRNLLVSSLLVAGVYAGCQSIKNPERAWSVYKADKSGSTFSPFKQINKDNVKDLQIAWTFVPQIPGQAPAAAPAGGGRGGNSAFGGECNPIIVDGVMYVTDTRNRVYAVDPATGKQKWVFDPMPEGGNPSDYSGVKRGVTYWEEGNDKRILYTAYHYLFAIDAVTGKGIPSFGTEGKVNLNVGMRDDPDEILASGNRVVPTSPGAIYKDLIILGTEVWEFYDALPGYQRAYNVKTGELVWTFHTVPWPGELGYDTWSKDSWKYVGGANNWSGMSIDDKRGMVFFSTGSAANDYFGGNRIGQNWFANSVVALDAATGKYKWHYQTIHHDLWDWDLASPPTLGTVMHNGKKVDIVAQASKVGFLYVLNRDTGEPLWPIEERPVPKSDIPGEQAWPTQPIPTKPARMTRSTITEADLNLEGQPQAVQDTILKRFRSMRHEGIFTPPSVRGTLMMPGSRGGVSWGGAAFDPYQGIIYVKANDNPEIETMRPIEPSPSETVYALGRRLYNNYCVSCHGPDRQGDASQGFPSLVDVKDRMSKEAIIAKINQGGGKMPSFANIIKGNEEAIAAFLRDDQNTTITRGVTVNRHPDVDTLPRWRNITAYSSFTVPVPPPPGAPAAAAGRGGRGGNSVQGVKGPWANLIAIDLSTGEYKWKVPYDTGSTGPTVTAGGLVFVTGTALRAFDKDNGNLLWEAPEGIRGTANSSVYMVGKKQYVVVAVSGIPNVPGAAFVAFALPDKK